MIKHSTVVSFANYVDYFRDTVYQDPLHLYNYTAKNFPQFNCLTFLHLSTVCKVASYFLCGVALILLRDDDPLGVETCRNVNLIL